RPAATLLPYTTLFRSRAFRPSPEEVRWATDLLAAFEAAGGRTIAFEGQMVDEVVAARARAVPAAAEVGGGAGGGPGAGSGAGRGGRHHAGAALDRASRVRAF